MCASANQPLRVVVYGGNLAALESALALRGHCGERCRVMLVSPVRDLPVRAHAAGAAPTEGGAARFDLGALAGEHQLGFRSDALVAVDPAAREARTITGARIRYDALVIAFGVRPRGAIPGVTTCWGAGDADALELLTEELRSGAVSRVAFAVDAANRWTLPTYELALTASRLVRRAAIQDVRLSLVTYEAEPAELIGAEGSRAIADRLAEAGIELRADSDPIAFEEGFLLLRDGRRVEVDRVLAMAAVDGPRIAGLPRDPGGFLSVDAFGRVHGAPGVWAAGEVTSYPVRQAGLAAQQARVVAASIASEAGAEVSSEPFRPILRGLLHSRSTLAPAPSLNGNAEARDGAPLWWPPEQLSGEHLSAHIGDKLGLRPPGGDESIPIAVELGPDGRSASTVTPRSDPRVPH
jgi:sulfide:quinone oxidoreductase